jgi:hypothetical protein
MLNSKNVVLSHQIINVEQNTLPNCGVLSFLLAFFFPKSLWIPAIKQNTIIIKCTELIFLEVIFFHNLVKSSDSDL